MLGTNNDDQQWTWLTSPINCYNDVNAARKALQDPKIRAMYEQAAGASAEAPAGR